MQIFAQVMLHPVKITTRHYSVLVQKIELFLYRSGQVFRAAGGWSSQDFQTIGTWVWQGCQPYAQDAFTPQEKFLVLISVRGWVEPRATVRPDGLIQSVLQPTALPRVPVRCDTNLYNFLYLNLIFGCVSLTYISKSIANTRNGVICLFNISTCVLQCYCTCYF